MLKFRPSYQSDKQVSGRSWLNWVQYLTDIPNHLVVGKYISLLIHSLRIFQYSRASQSVTDNNETVQEYSANGWSVNNIYKSLTSGNSHTKYDCVFVFSFSRLDNNARISVLIGHLINTLPLSITRTDILLSNFQYEVPIVAEIDKDRDGESSTSAPARWISEDPRHHRCSPTKSELQNGTRRYLGANARTISGNRETIANGRSPTRSAASKFR